MAFMAIRKHIVPGPKAVKPLNVALGAAVARVRKAKRLTQVQLAQRANIDPQHLSRIERGLISSPGIETMHALAAALGVSVEALSGGQARKRQSFSPSAA